MKRDAAQTIFRTVVFAGAMLGAPACAKKTPAPAAPPANAAQTTEPAMTQDQTPTTTDPVADPCAGDPCAGGERPRGVDDDGGGGEGRGFILS